MANPTTNFGWVMPTSTDLVTDLPADFAIFGQAVDTSMADLKGGTTGQVLSKATNADMDFTWVAQDDSNAIQNAIVDAKGDLITATAADTPARLAVGNNGETLVADSSTSSGLRWQGSAISKNAVFNSGYDVFQRTSAPTTGITTSGGIAYTLDRWVSWTQAAPGSVVTSQQVTGDTTNLPFVRYCARFRRATSNTDTGLLVLGQVLENTDSARFIGQTVTFSFYARKGANYSATSNVLNAVVYSNTTTDASYNTVYVGAATPVTVNATLTSNWQRFQGTGTISASATQISFGFNFAPTGTAGAADYFEVTGVQLELGSIATPFAKMGGGTIQGETSACQRYYYRFAGGVGAIWTAVTTASTLAFGTISHAIPMRTAPSFAVGGTLYLQTYGTSGANYSAASPTVDYSLSYANGGQLRLGGYTGMTTNLPVNFYYASSGYLEASAEL